jgi:hypothetical protein
MPERLSSQTQPAPHPGRSKNGEICGELNGSLFQPGERIVPNRMVFVKRFLSLMGTMDAEKL